MNKQRLMRYGRRALIVVLVITALLLLRETGDYSGLKEKLLGSGEGTENVSGAEPAAGSRLSGTVQPMAAVVCGADGGRCGAAYDRESVAGIFSRFSAGLGEALGSAGTPEEITEAQFCAYLNGCGVFLRFYNPQPLELLSAWLGTEVSSGAAGDSAALLYLCAEGENTLLCYRRDASAYFRCSTAVSADGLRSRAAEYSDNGTFFAYENPLLSGGDCCAVVLSGGRTARRIRSAVPTYSGTETDELLQAVGMNSYITSSYTEADGTEVFVDDESTLRFRSDGSVVFRRPGTFEAPASQPMSAAVNLAWQAAERSIGRTCGDGELVFAGASYSAAQRSYTVYLDYAVDGIPVQLASGHGAEIVLRGDTILQARLQPRRFSAGEDTAVLLPDLQAAAIAAAEGSAAVLCYSGGGDTMNCVWVSADG